MSAALEEKVQSEKERHGFMQKLVDRGIRAQLRSGSLVTGQLYVAFDRFPNAPKAKVDWTKEPPELPVMPGGLQDLENKITSIVAKIDKMPLDAIGEDLKKLLVTTDQLMKPHRRGNHPRAEDVPGRAARQLAAKRVLENTDATLVGKDAPAQQELREALQEIDTRGAGDPGVHRISGAQPDALIRGKTQEKP